MKCVHCNKEAEYISPRNYCLRHWVEWWHATDNPTSSKEHARVIRNTMRRIRYADAKDVKAGRLIPDFRVVGPPYFGK